MKEIIVWFGMKTKLNDNETTEELLPRIRDGSIIFDSPDLIRITESTSLASEGKEVVLVDEKY